MKKQDIVESDKEYAKYSKKTNKIGKTGIIMASIGFLASTPTLSMWNEIKPELRLLLGIPAGASFMTGLVLIAIAQSRSSHVQDQCIKSIQKIMDEKKNLSR